jgi:hypothetical protein
MLSYLSLVSNKQNSWVWYGLLGVKVGVGKGVTCGRLLHVLVNTAGID